MKQLPLNDHTDNLRIACAVVLACVVMFYMYLRHAIVRSNDQTPVAVKTGDTATITTACAHDLEQWKKVVRALLIGICIGTGIHLKFGFAQPLVMSPLIQTMTLISSPLFAIHIFGCSAEGKQLERPFLQPGEQRELPNQVDLKED